jgi:Zn-dependent protease with chaperone function
MTTPPDSRPMDLAKLVHPKERVYFGICVVVSIAIYLMLIATVLGGGPTAGPILFYAIAITIAYFLFHGVFLGHVRGNAVKVSARQFPEIHALVEEHSRRLGMEAPAVFVLQAGGVLNAFATRFLGRNFVILYSDVLALATQQGERAVSFVVAHELGHIRRKHMTRRALLYPSMVFPFLGSAYSRACEYTCDRFGNALQPEGGIDGLLVLAAGRDLYSRVSAEEFSRQRETEAGFFVRFSEIVSTHPNLTKRVAAVAEMRKAMPV